MKELTEGRGVDVCYDPVGGDVFDRSSKCIAHHGRLLVIGFASGRIPSIAANRLLLKSMSVIGVFLGRECIEDPSYYGNAHVALTDLLKRKKIRPIVAKEFPLECAPEALRFLADRKVAGKVVLRPDFRQEFLFSAHLDGAENLEFTDGFSLRFRVVLVLEKSISVPKSPLLTFRESPKMLNKRGHVDLTVLEINIKRDK